MPSVEITCWGHPNVLATHKSTWEITKDGSLTPKGDCIIGVKSSLGAKDLPHELKSHLLSGGKIMIEIEVGGFYFSGKAEGHPLLTFEHPEEMVFRKSNFVSDRTVGINCSFSSREIPRKMVDLMKDMSTMITVILSWDNLSLS